MPRPVKKDACNTCRKRKVKCDGCSPVCGPCHKLSRYCDRSEAPVRFQHWSGALGKPGNRYRSQTPRDELQDESIARLFSHYISNIAYWYDLSDAEQSFELKVPELALDEPLLFYAIVAVAAMHLSKTTTTNRRTRTGNPKTTKGNLRTVAETYHDKCAACLIALQPGDRLISNGRALAATCLLRSYEIFDGNDIDPNRHLWGVYSMASHRGLLTGSLPRDLLAAGFWNYLREDITYSLFERCPLKMRLHEVPMEMSQDTDPDFLNAASLVLGKIINVAFDHFPSQEECETMLSMVRDFCTMLPSRIRPYSMGSEVSGTGFRFAAIRFLHPCHAATFHYVLVALFILANAVPQPMLDQVENLDPLLGFSRRLRQDLMHDWALQICGIAFTSNSPTVLVNSFGPMAHCAEVIKAENARDELRRQLLACKGTVGWPLQNLRTGATNTIPPVERFSELGKPAPQRRETSALLRPQVTQTRIQTFSLPEFCDEIKQDQALNMLRGPMPRVLVAGKSSIRSFATLRPATPPTVIRLSSGEIKSAKLGDRNLEIAVRHVHQDGLVVVENVVPHEDLDYLNVKMVEDARTLQSRGEDSPFNYNQGNLQQDAPPVAKYFLPSIFTNPIATQITTAVLGPRPKWTFCSANSAMPPLPGASPQRQPVHSDADFAHPSHPFALVTNIPLVETRPDNGSTELWLGTHSPFGIEAQEGAHGERASGRIREDQLREREKIAPPVQPTIKKGSLVIRDLRLWHAGMPNMSDEVRVMLAMIHFAPWYRNPMRLELGEDVKPILERLDKEGRLGLEAPVDWVDMAEAMERYLNRGFGNSYDFNQTP